MTFTTYVEGIRQDYRGYAFGERVYRQLATKRAIQAEQTKLAVIAAVEQLTHQRLRRIALRLGVALEDIDWQQIVERRVQGIGAASLE